MPCFLPCPSPLGDADGKWYQRDIKESRCEHDDQGGTKRMQSNGMGMKRRRRAKNADEKTAPIQEQQCIAGGAHPFTQVMSEQQGGQVDK